MSMCSAIAPLVEEGPTDDVPLIIILTVCIVGIILVGLNVLLILFFIRRRRKKLDKGWSGMSKRFNCFYLRSVCCRFGSFCFVCLFLCSDLTAISCFETTTMVDAAQAIVVAVNICM